MARKYSQDPSVVDNDGSLGYITAFQTVYPFESAAYNTEPGNISSPIRTKFGYHIVKVEDIRPAQGELLTAHILVKTSKDDASDELKAKEKKIKDIYKKATKKKMPFDQLAKEFSDDKSSAKKGGKLPWFSSGSMLEEFEQAAFALADTGNISKPFKSKIGWHIVKLLNRKTLAPFDEAKTEIKKRIERDSRSRITKNEFVNRLKKDYKYEEYSLRKTELIGKVDNTILKGQWKASMIPDSMDEELFSVTVNRAGEEERMAYRQQEFARFLEINQVKDISRTPISRSERLYDMFVEQKLKEVEETMLEYKYPEFGRLLKEFRDGNLLYELMSEKVWTKAMQDSTGLETFFDANKSKYQWAERAKAAIFYCNTEELAKETRQKVLATDEAGVTKMQEELQAQQGMLNMRVDIGSYEQEQNKILDQADWKVGTSDIITNNDGSYAITRIFEILPPAQKELEEARGYVIADYQSQLEKAWIEELREKYPVKVDNKILKALYK